MTTALGISLQEALALTRLQDKDDILELVDRASEVRKKYRGNSVDLCSITNAKSGRCEEDCIYCAQSARHTTHTDVYGMKSVDEIETYRQTDDARGPKRSPAGCPTAHPNRSGNCIGNRRAPGEK